MCQTNDTYLHAPLKRLYIVGGHEWVARQGFAIDSFMGGRDAVKLSLEEAPSGDAGMLPTKEKLTHR